MRWGKGGVPGGQQLSSGELGCFACGGSRRESASAQRDSMLSCVEGQRRVQCPRACLIAGLLP